jgi:hypothetical protein
MLHKINLPFMHRTLNDSACLQQCFVSAYSAEFEKLGQCTVESEDPHPD